MTHDTKFINISNVNQKLYYKTCFFDKLCETDFSYPEAISTRICLFLTENEREKQKKSVKTKDLTNNFLKLPL